MRLSAAGLGVWLICSALVMAAATRNAEAQWGFGFEDREDWSMMLSGGSTSFGLAGGLRWGEATGDSTVDVASGLDLDRSESYAGELRLKPGNTLVRLGFLPLAFGGDTILSGATIVDGVTYAAGDRVHSELALDAYNLALGYPIRMGRHWVVAPVVQLSVLGGLVNPVDLDLTGSGAQDSFLVPITLSGLRVEASPLARLTVFAEAKGFAAGNWGVLEDARFLDGTAGVTLSLTRNLLLTARYRRAKFDFEARSTEANLDLEGFLLSFDLRF